MSSFFSKTLSGLEPYVPGEQPAGVKYIKLNTNENPYPPCEAVVRAAESQAKQLHLYSDPDCRELIKAFCSVYGVDENEVIFTNGSDDILNFAFKAFCDSEHPAVFADITYGFYPVFAAVNCVPFETIPLKDDFTQDISSYIGVGKTVFIANPNAPTGIALKRSEIERIIESNPDNVVVVDEAYVDFGAESCLPLIKKYKNLLVTQTFSKSRSMAGARLGFGVACRELIADLNTIRFSTNPYNINRMTATCGVACLKNDAYTRENCEKIKKNRAYLEKNLAAMEFSFPPSMTNFVFAKHNCVSGEKVYLELKKRGILVRHFTGSRIADYNRITVGTREQCDSLINALKEIIQ
ncbi:MAG: histidinol-phosphate transaminase [Clostridiales bacterium]|nr:histidinol-phosphate transaminase [Clostridiales bacterium]